MLMTIVINERKYSKKADEEKYTGDIQESESVGRGFRGVDGLQCILDSCSITNIDK